MATARKKKASVRSRSPFSRVEKELTPLGRGVLLRGRVGRPERDDAKLIEALNSYIALNLLAKIVERRLQAIKPVLHEVALGEGAGTKNGGFEILIGGNKVTRERRPASEPDPEKLKALLETRGLKVEAVFDTVPSLVFNASKLLYLIEHGDLKKEEVTPLHTVGWAIKAAPGKALEAVLKKVFLTKKVEEGSQTEKTAARKRA